MNRALLLEIAKKTIWQKFDKSIKIDREKILKEYPFLNKKMATFVTLNRKSKLRGCIGTLIATKTLLEDLISNSYMAAFEDPRFHELTFEEFKEIEIEISVLTHPKELLYEEIYDLKRKLIPNVHGVILEYEGKRSTFLPQVWKMLPEFDDFFAQLCYKGGFEIDDEFKPKVYIYKVDKIK